MQNQPTKAIIEAHFLPGLQYLSKFLLYEQVYIDGAAFYQKRSFRNRSLLNSPNGLLTLSVPLIKGKNSQMPMHQVQVAYQDDWARKTCRAIQSSYGKSAFFLHYFDELESIILQEHASLLELNVRLIEFLLDSFQIDCPIEITPDYRDPTAVGGDIKDLRNTILLKQPLPDPHFEEKSYPQVFESKTGFVSRSSALELLFTQGPTGIFHLQSCII